MMGIATPKAPAVFWVCFGCAWMALMLVLFGIMVTGYSAVWGIKGILVATTLLALSALAYPVFTW